jgi:hypothetical protein
LQAAGDVVDPILLRFVRMHTQKFC